MDERASLAAVCKTIPSVLASPAFESAWLSAAAARGELQRCGPAYTPNWVSHTPAVRAAALSTEVPRQLCVHRLTAAWVYGFPILVTPLQANVLVGKSKKRSTKPPGYEIGYARLSADHWQRIGSLAVTTSVKTIQDLAVGSDPSPDSVCARAALQFFAKRNAADTRTAIQILSEDNQVRAAAQLREIFAASRR